MVKPTVQSTRYNENLLTKYDNANTTDINTSMQPLCQFGDGLCDLGHFPIKQAFLQVHPHKTVYNLSKASSACLKREQLQLY